MLGTELVNKTLLGATSVGSGFVRYGTSRIGLLDMVLEEKGFVRCGMNWFAYCTWFWQVLAGFGTAWYDYS